MLPGFRSSREAEVICLPTELACLEQQLSRLSLSNLSERCLCRACRDLHQGRASPVAALGCLTSHGIPWHPEMGLGCLCCRGAGVGTPSIQRTSQTLCFGGCIQAPVLDGPFPVAQGPAAGFTEGYSITPGTRAQEIAVCPGAASSCQLLAEPAMASPAPVPWESQVLAGASSWVLGMVLTRNAWGGSWHPL